MGKFPEAKVSLDGAHTYWCSIDNRTMLADNIYDAVEVFYAQGDFDRAIGLVQEGLEISRSIGSVHLEAIGLAASVQFHMNSGHIGEALEAIENGTEKLNEIVATGFVNAFFHAITFAIYRLASMSEQAILEVSRATDILDSTRKWRFRSPLLLAYLEQGRLHEAGATLQSFCEQPGFESKRPLAYFGLLTSMTDLVKGELLLAEGDYLRVSEYELKVHGLAEDLSGDLILPDLLRMRGQALIGLDRTGEAKEALVKAREIAEARGSRLTLWRVLYEMSRVAGIEDLQEDQEQLLRQCRELIGYLADHCGRPEVRDGFLNHSVVRKALALD